VDGWHLGGQGNGTTRATGGRRRNGGRGGRGLSDGDCAEILSLSTHDPRC
jgi:hypothetical protein